MYYIYSLKINIFYRLSLLLFPLLMVFTLNKFEILMQSEFSSKDALAVSVMSVVILFVAQNLERKDESNEVNQIKYFFNMNMILFLICFFLNINTLAAIAIFYIIVDTPTFLLFLKNEKTK